jgi:hypothetical protein
VQMLAFIATHAAFGGLRIGHKSVRNSIRGAKR